MRRACAFLLMFLLAAGCALPVLAEGQRAPDYIMEGFDGNGSNHDWETNLFFQRMQEKTGVSFQFRQAKDAEVWAVRKKGIAEGEDLPDVLFKAEMNAGEVRDLYEAGILIDLRPYLAEYAPDLWALLEAHPDWMAAISMADGAIPALPGINELPNNDLIWINTAWLKNLRLEMPTTAEELAEVLRAFKTGDPNRNGRADEVPLTFIGMWELRFLGHAFGITDNDYYVSCREGQVHSALTTDENRAFLSWLHALWAEGLLDHQGFVTMDQLRQITDDNAANPYGVILSTSPLTVLPARMLGEYAALDPLIWNGTRVYRDLLGNVTRGTFAVTKNCREPERLVAWVNTLYTEAGGILMQAGQENEEYFWNEDGKWEWMADVNTVANSILPDATISEGGAVPGLFTADFQEKYDDSSTAFLVGEMRRIRQWTVMPFPLVTLSREDAARIGELHGAIAPFAEARMAAFVTGDTPLNDETWQAFCEGVRQRGIEEEIALWQKYAR